MVQQETKELPIIIVSPFGGAIQGTPEGVVNDKGPDQPKKEEIIQV
jgi:hypothetical protein